MKKNNNSSKSPKRATKARKTDRITIGMDLGDKTSRVCFLNEECEVIREGSVATTKKGMAQMFGAMGHCRIALEVGTHSPWVSRLLKSFGHEVIVANARQVKLISNSSRKDDKLDALMLARLAKADPELLRPIRHRELCRVRRPPAPLRKTPSRFCGRPPNRSPPRESFAHPESGSRPEQSRF